MSKAESTTRIVSGKKGPFHKKHFLVHHAGGVVRTLTFRVGKHKGHYEGTFQKDMNGTPVVHWREEP